MNKQKILLIEKYVDEELSEKEQIEVVHLLSEDTEFGKELALCMEIKGLTFCAQHNNYKNLENSILSEIDNEGDKFEKKIMNSLPEVKDYKGIIFPIWARLTLVAQFIVVISIFFIFDKKDNRQ